MISDLIQAGRYPHDRARIKAAEIAKLNHVGTFKHKPLGLEIDILSLAQIDKGVEVFARVWKNGKQLSFGDGTVDIERFQIINPPILVDHPSGTIEKIGPDGSVRKLKEDPIEAIRHALIHSVTVAAKESDRIVPGKRGSTTTTVYGSNDGRMRRLAAGGESWATIIAGAGVDVNSSGPDSILRWNNAAVSNLFTLLARYICRFDTSSIPDTDAVSAVAASLTGNGTHGDPDSNTPNFDIYIATPADPTSIVAADFTQIGSTSQTGSPVIWANLPDVDNEVATWNFNATGKGNINITGNTVLGWRNANYDVAAVQPTWAALSETNLGIYLVDASGTSKDPVLVITHASAAVNVTVSPAAIAGTFAIIDPTVSTTRFVTVSPSSVDGTFAILAPTITAVRSVTVLPSPVTGTWAVLDPTEYFDTLAVYMSGLDITRKIMTNSMTVRNVLSNLSSTAEFRMNKFGDHVANPVLGADVLVYVGPNKVFGGRITVVNEEYDTLDYVSYHVQCADYTRDIDKKLVVETYTNQSVNAIIADIASKYFPSGVSLSGVDCNLNINYIGFNYEYPSACLNQLAQLINYNWYIDPDKVLKFFSTTSETSPFDLSDTNGNYIYKSLVVRKDISQVRNTVFVRGGEYLGNRFTAAYVSETNQTQFPLPYRFNDLHVNYTGQIKHVGIDNIDDPTGYDALFNFQEKLVRFRADRIRSNKAVRISGLPYLPVLAKVSDPGSIAQFSAAEGNDGIHQSVVVDNSINTKEGATQRGQAELLKYASTYVEAEFQTYRNGLKIGQRITVQSTLRGVDQEYIISKVEIVPFDNINSSVYRISLVTTRTYDYVQFLKDLVLKKAKELNISTNEVLDAIQANIERITISETVATSTAHHVQAETAAVAETFTAQSLNYPVVFVYGPNFTPSAKKRQFLFGGSGLS